MRVAASLDFLVLGYGSSLPDGGNFTGFRVNVWWIGGLVGS